jgi:Uma2 family endonuclease
MTGFSEEPAPFGAQLDKAAFFAWLQGQEGGRYELKDGYIVMHAGSTKKHWAISGRFIGLLARALDPGNWVVGAADFAVEIGDDIRYPDVILERAGPIAPDALASTQPVLLVEVLSPSSVSRDMHLKLAEYTSLQSLQCYIVASQDEAIVWLWQRDEDTGAFPSQPEEIMGLGAEIKLHALGIGLALGEIYRGLLKA